MGYLRRTKFFEMPKNLWFFEHDTRSVGYMEIEFIVGALLFLIALIFLVNNSEISFLVSIIFLILGSVFVYHGIKRR